MPKDITKFIIAASLATLFVSGCKTSFAPGPSPRRAGPLQKAVPAPEEKGKAPEDYVPKAIATAEGSRSALDRPSYDKPESAQRPSREEVEKSVAPTDVNAGHVGVMLPLSGAAGAAGGRVYDGIKLAFLHSRAKYPWLRLQLAVRDTKSAAHSAGDAVAMATELIEKEKAIALIGPLIDEAAEASAEVTNRLETPMLTPFAPRMCMKPDFAWVFRNSLTDRLQAQGVATYAVENLGLRRFAVLYPSNWEGVELKDAFTQAVAKLGGEASSRTLTRRGV